jgi:hypothetical protein
VVGQGGIPGAASGTSGSDSSFNGEDVVAYGGGGGSGQNAGPGMEGGSGGGDGYSGAGIVILKYRFR